MAGPNPPPEYKVYRSRRNPLANLRASGLEGLRRGRDGGPTPGDGRSRPPIRRILKWVAIVVVGWLVLAFILFFISACQEQNEGVRPSALRQLDGSSSLLIGSTILVIGSDQRPSTSPESQGPPRADSMMLLHAGIGSVRRVSILRDSFAEIPGQSAQKINAAYAIGGTSLLIRTLKQFFNDKIEINHVIRLTFDDFPKMIDAMGGIDVTLKTCVRSEKFNGRRVNLKRGTHHLDGQQALRFARVRKNLCRPNEDDRARAERQQMVLSAMTSRMTSLGTFFRAPFIAWRVPQTINTDLAGPGLTALALDVVTGGQGDTKVLEPSSLGPGGSLIISETERARAAKYLDEGD